MFTIKPHNHQRCSEDSNKPSAHKDPETPQRLPAGAPSPAAGRPLPPESPSLSPQVTTVPSPASGRLSCSSSRHPSLLCPTSSLVPLP